MLILGFIDCSFLHERGAGEAVLGPYVEGFNDISFNLDINYCGAEVKSHLFMPERSGRFGERRMNIKAAWTVGVYESRT
jgi:hypothetical protein